ncbi:Two component regulator three Y domain protein [Aureitalea sp. L0-47]|uniref:Two component regulator three Y domain protein n=1 Tax=Aureitalea sp. L0-47 TaxID=2816962 RepID=UPI00223769FC|nr:Two component regulator three Y domain protein [Aureitalea sp. L0-47]MCW5520433.1 Two component regulator three Y domain protein [Aureitalea sp. L0-47]
MKNVISFLGMILLISAVHAQVAPAERQALLDFYQSTNGDQWIHSWDIEKPVAEWQGVTVEDNTVTGIRLLFNNVNGTLPESIGNLKNLRILELSFNKLSGELPESLGNLTNLELLAFNSNILHGEIPASVGNLKKLKQLHLSSNFLTGQLPGSMIYLKNLEVFNVFDNKLSGELPSGLSQINTLKEVVIAENDFTNAQQFSFVVMSNTAQLNFNENGVVPAAKSVIAIETSDDN